MAQVPQPDFISQWWLWILPLEVNITVVLLKSKYFSTVKKYRDYEKAMYKTNEKNIYIKSSLCLDTVSNDLLPVDLKLLYPCRWFGYGYPPECTAGWWWSSLSSSMTVKTLKELRILSLPFDLKSTSPYCLIIKSIMKLINMKPDSGNITTHWRWIQFLKF